MEPNIPALRKLAQLLRKPLPRKTAFDLGGWGHTNCNTVVCACGLAALHPWFNKRGFTAQLGPIESDGVRAIVPSLRGMGQSFVFPDGWAPVERFFGLTEDQAQWLFSAASYARGNRLDVARRIEGFINQCNNE
jgi:hypothetical protein